MNRFFAKLFCVGIAALLLLEPAILSAQEGTGTPTSENSVQKPAQPDTPQSESELPESPGASQIVKPDSTSTAPPGAFQQTGAESQPSGTAAAPSVQVTGAAVSRPAGAAVAPPKQRQARTFLIKLGLIAGVGVAVGTVAALSFSSPARVPGSH